MSYLPTEILDYVGTHEPEEGTVYGIGQRELAKALGYHPSSMSRPLAELVRQGHLTRRRAPVRGGLRRQLVYSLTTAGRAQLQRQEEHVPFLATSLPPPPNPFVGRRAELREILSHGSTGGLIMHIEGASGMGKSALVARAVRRLRTGRIPFWFTIRLGSTPRHFTQALAHALASVGSRQLAYYAQLPRDPNGREVADLALRALGTAPLLGIVDDCQVSSADFKSFLTEFSLYFVRGDRTDFLIYLSQEPPFVTVGHVPLQLLRLEGIDRTAAHKLTDLKGGLGERFEAVFGATRGSPLLLRLASVAPEVDITQGNLPSLIVGRLSEMDLEGLLSIAASNEPMPHSFLQETGGLRTERITELVNQGLVQRATEGRLEVLQSVRAAILARVTVTQVRAAHLALARYYGRSHRTEAVRERFLHLISGQSWRLAGELLTHQESFLLASGYSDAVRNGLAQLTVSSTQEAIRVRALRTQAQLLRVHSEWTEAIACLENAVTESRKDPRAQAECLLSMVEPQCRLQRIEEAQGALDRARGMAPASRRIQEFLTHCEARILEARGNLREAQELYSQVFQAASRSGHTDLSLEALARWSRLASLTVEEHGMGPLVDFGIREARNSARMDIVFSLMSARSRRLALLGKNEEALAEMNRLRGEAESLGYLTQLVHALSGLSALAGEMNRWPEANGYARQASELAERLGNETIRGYTLSILCASELRQSHLQDAVTHGELAVQILSNLPPSDSLPMAHAYLAEAYLESNLRPAARLNYERAIAISEKLGMDWWRKQVETELGPKIMISDTNVGEGAPKPENCKQN